MNDAEYFSNAILSLLAVSVDDIFARTVLPFPGPLTPYTAPIGNENEETNITGNKKAVLYSGFPSVCDCLRFVYTFLAALSDLDHRIP